MSNLKKLAEETFGRMPCGIPFELEKSAIARIYEALEQVQKETLAAERKDLILSEEELTKLATDYGGRCPACGEECLWTGFYDGYRYAEIRHLTKTK